MVEDEASVRNLVASALRTEGYRLLLAASAEEAIAEADQYADRIHLLLTDANMPGKSGVELASALTARRPDLRVIITSGYTEIAITGLDSRIEVLQKPFTPRELRRRVRDALDQPTEQSR